MRITASLPLLLSIGTFGCAHLKVPADHVVTVFGEVKLWIPPRFVCIRKGESYAIGDLSDPDNVLWIYRPKTKRLSGEAIDGRIEKGFARISKISGASGLHSTRIFARMVGPMQMHFLELRGFPANLYQYAVVTTLGGRLTLMELHLIGGIDHPTSTGSLLLKVMGSLELTKNP